MSEAGMISWGDIALDWVVKPSGEAILNVGLSSIGLFSNAMKAIFTSMTMAEFSDYAKTHIRGMNVDSKEAMWGMLYRR
jgi:hypothetical protein